MSNVGYGRESHKHTEDFQKVTMRLQRTQRPDVSINTIKSDYHLVNLVRLLCSLFAPFPDGSMRFAA